MKIIMTVILVLCSVQLSHAMSLDKELAYRVRFSKASDVALLLKKGANPNARNKVGLPIVSVAAGRKDDDAIEVLRTLVKHGADINKGGLNNQYPLIIAAREDNLKMIRFLLDETDVDLTVRDLNGLLPMEIADYYGSVDVTRVLTELTQKRLEEERKRVSPERRDKLVEKLAYHYCEHQYMYYYHKSRQSGVPKKQADALIDASRADGQAQIDELYTVFQFPLEKALDMKNKIGGVVTTELNDMISNRERKRRGIGTQNDKTERCARIAGGWYDEYKIQQDEFDKALNE